MRTQEHETGTREIEVGGTGGGPNATLAVEAGQRRRDLLDVAQRAIERVLADDSDVFVRESRQTGAQ